MLRLVACMLYALFTTGLLFLPCYAERRVCLGETHHKEYDASVEVCCDGKISPRARDQDCCGDKHIYFTSLSICCGGKIENRYSPPKGSRLRSCTVNDEQCREQTCCGQKPVDKDDTMCCNDQTVHLNHTQQLQRDFLQCCDGVLINTLSHFCCGGVSFSRNSVQSCCDGKVYDKQAERCLTSYKPNRIVNKYKNVCGSLEYDRRHSSCCSGTLHSMPEINLSLPLDKNPQFGCCDSIAYDVTKEKCCRESHSGFPTHTIANKQNIYCCGNGSYNATHQDCYNGKRLEKVAGKVRCGYGYIDGETEKCCSNNVYNVENQQCCTGDKSSVIPKEEICCNGEGTNETMLCCEGITPRIKRKPDDDLCCYNYKARHAETYNSRINEHCVEGRVITLPKDVEPCGISQFYYPQIQICCGENVYNIADGFDDCCGDMPFSTLRQQCCNYEISNIALSEGSCCSKDFRVYRFDDEKNPCSSYCGNEKYDDTQKICCQNVLHDINEDTECCGSSAIHSFYQGCCGGLFSWSKNGNTRCCGNRDLFDKKHAICSKKKIIPRDLTVRKLSNTQYLCSRAALKYFDGGVKYACESQNIFKGRLVKVEVVEEAAPNMTHINLSFADVTGLDRGANFTSWKVPNALVMNIEVPKHDDIKCKKSYFTKFCKIIVFFNGRFKDGKIKIGKNSKFFMTRYTRKQEALVTKKLSYEFCKNNFNVR